MRTSQPHQRIENRPNRALRWPDLGELWQCRELAAFLALRDLKIPHKQAMFGASWAVPAPRGGRRLHYGLQALRQRAQRGDSPTRCLPASAWQCGRTRLERDESHSAPREQLPLGDKSLFPPLPCAGRAVLPGVLDFLVFVMLAVFLPIYHVDPTWASPRCRYGCSSWS
jgi:hypothetical protein